MVTQGFNSILYPQMIADFIALAIFPFKSHGFIGFPILYNGIGCAVSFCPIGQ